MADADAGHPRRAGFPDSILTGHRRLYGATAPGHREQVSGVSGREPLGVEARQQCSVVSHRNGVDGFTPEEVAQRWLPAIEGHGLQGLRVGLDVTPLPLGSYPPPRL